MCIYKRKWKSLKENIAKQLTLSLSISVLVCFLSFFLSLSTLFPNSNRRLTIYLSVLDSTAFAHEIWCWVLSSDDGISGDQPHSSSLSSYQDGHSQTHLFRKSQTTAFFLGCLQWLQQQQQQLHKTHHHQLLLLLLLLLRCVLALWVDTEVQSSQLWELEFLSSLWTYRERLWVVGVYVRVIEWIQICFK